MCVHQTHTGGSRGATKRPESQIVCNRSDLLVAMSLQYIVALPPSIYPGHMCTCIHTSKRTDLLVQPPDGSVAAVLLQHLPVLLHEQDALCGRVEALVAAGDVEADLCVCG